MNSQLDLFIVQRIAIAAMKEPYAPFDSMRARGIILSLLHDAAGGWVRRRVLRKATGMRQAHVSCVLVELCSTGLIERTERLPIIHPMHGHMGQTMGYRIRLTSQGAA